jgi:hypothetical protein
LRGGERRALPHSDFILSTRWCTDSEVRITLRHIRCELRKQRCTSNSLILSAAFEFEVPERVCGDGIGTSNSPHQCLMTACLVEKNAKGIRPCFGFGPGDRPHFSLRPSPSLRGGWRADKAHGLDRQAGGGPFATGPGRETSRPAPCGAPTRHLRLTPQSAIGPRQELYVPGGLVPRPPVGQACVRARPQVAAPGPRSQDAS